jgi:hypothetical protein
MFTSAEFRAKAARFGKRAESAETPEQRQELLELEDSFNVLADNEQWLSDNHDKTVHSKSAPKQGLALAQEEEHILRCLGAAVVMHWNTLPDQVRRELFDSAGTMGELVETAQLRAAIACFLQK